ncbi:UNKNOWN [Stylonychia lemnae]|uniref:Uncharacterized protein n=1 Tax=Stylonychia lemnae TaxID=5949 RepID=A0A078AEB0_STYLE|nr:UNKNOWN [Stylonychia lemnae]|eukprot:CDW80594.1 UNKNOWN [Stylonychia lemnae]
MSSTHYYDNERIKPLVTSFINANFDFEAIPLQLKKSMRVGVQEHIAFFWVNDGYHFLEAVFTKEAVNEFRKNWPHLKFIGLKEKILLITKWSLRIREADSRKLFTSYQNLQIQIVIEGFKPILHEKPNPKQHFQATNIYHDEEIQTYLRHKRHEMIRGFLSNHIFFRTKGENKLELPSIKLIKKQQSQYELLKVQNDSSSDNEMLDLADEQDKNVKQQKVEADLHNSKLIKRLTVNISEQEVFRCQMAEVQREQLIEDEYDFKEFKEKFSYHTINDNQQTAASSQVSKYTISTSTDLDENPNIADLKRYIIQEMGEDEFNSLVKKKTERLQNQLEDEFERMKIKQNLEYYSKEQSREEFKKEMERKIQEKQDKKEKAIKKKIVNYRMQLSTNQIKEKVLRFMTTFESVQGKEGEQQKSINAMATIEKREIPETRLRSYSQENIVRDQSEILEARSMVSHINALSQYQCRKVGYRGDETESEHEEDMSMLVETSKKTVKLLQKIQPTISVFKQYLSWFAANEVISKRKYDEELELKRIQEEREIEIQRIRDMEEQKEREILEEKERQRQQRREEQERQKQKRLEEKQKRQAQILEAQQKAKKRVIQSSSEDSDAEMKQESEEDDLLENQKLTSFIESVNMFTSIPAVKTNPNQGLEKLLEEVKVEIKSADLIQNAPKEKQPSPEQDQMIKQQTPQIQQQVPEINEPKVSRIDERLNDLSYILDDKESDKEVTDQEEEEESEIENVQPTIKSQEQSTFMPIAMSRNVQIISSQDSEEVNEVTHFQQQQQQTQQTIEEQSEQDSLILEVRDDKTQNQQVEICTFNEVPKSQDNLFGQQQQCQQDNDVMSIQEQESQQNQEIYTQLQEPVITSQNQRNTPQTDDEEIQLGKKSQKKTAQNEGFQPTKQLIQNMVVVQDQSSLLQMQMVMPMPTVEVQSQTLRQSQQSQQSSQQLVISQPLMQTMEKENDCGGVMTDESEERERLQKSQKSMWMIQDRQSTSRRNHKKQDKTPLKVIKKLYKNDYSSGDQADNDDEDSEVERKKRQSKKQMQKQQQQTQQQQSFQQQHQQQQLLLQQQQQLLNQSQQNLQPNLIYQQQLHQQQLQIQQQQQQLLLQQQQQKKSMQMHQQQTPHLQTQQMLDRQRVQAQMPQTMYQDISQTMFQQPTVPSQQQPQFLPQIAQFGQLPQIQPGYQQTASNASLISQNLALKRQLEELKYLASISQPQKRQKK